MLGIKTAISYHVKSHLNIYPYRRYMCKHNCIFIHIPKAAGNALIKSLYGKSATGHDPLIRYRKYDPVKFDVFFKFSVVRNPWDRMVSSFHYLKQGGIGFFDKDFSDKYLLDCNEFSDFLAKMMQDKKFESKVLSWVHFVPQINFLSLDGDAIDVDLCVKLEDLPNSFDMVCKKLGVVSKVMLKDNASIRKDYRSYYSAVTAKYVGELYCKDVSLLGYEF